MTKISKFYFFIIYICSVVVFNSTKINDYIIPFNSKDPLKSIKTIKNIQTLKIQWNIF